MHDQKFGTFYSLRPEDGLYGSNEPKKCEIRPVVSSIVHFKVFKSYFIYIIEKRDIYFESSNIPRLFAKGCLLFPKIQKKKSPGNASLFNSF